MSQPVPVVEIMADTVLDAHDEYFEKLYGFAGRMLCPVCSRKGSINKIPLMPICVLALAKLCEMYDGWPVSVNDFCSKSQYTNVSKLGHWGFVQVAPKTDETKKSSGMYIPTPLAYSFLAGRTAVSSHVWQYNSEIVGVEQTMVTVQDVMKEMENYNHRELIDSWGKFTAGQMHRHLKPGGTNERSIT